MHCVSLRKVPADEPHDGCLQIHPRHRRERPLLEEQDGADGHQEGEPRTCHQSPVPRAEGSRDEPR